MKVAAIGGGSWGTTVAHLCAHNSPTMLYSRRPEVAEAITERHENPRYLAGFELHPTLRASSDLEEVVAGADVLVMGVASIGLQETLDRLRPIVPDSIPIVSLTKGLERTGRRMTEVIGDCLPSNPVGVLTGPNLAKEILAGHAAASVIAFEDAHVAGDLQKLLATASFASTPIPI